MQVNVSIIIPCYGVEKYLNRCLESVTKQTLKSIEIILVDDGSPDNVPGMCDDWAQRDSRIKVIHKKNAGLGYARNTGIEHASGEYIAFVDSDDFINLEMYETLYNIAKKHDLDVIYCGFRKEFKRGFFINVNEYNDYTEFTGSDVLSLIPDFIASGPNKRSEYRYDMSVWHSIYRSSTIKNNDIRFVSERDYASEDVPFQIDFLSFSKHVAFIPDVLYTYCFNGTSLTKAYPINKYYKIRNLYFLLEEKSRCYDEKGFRAKRLFIGYVRAYIRKWVVNEKRSKAKEIIRIIMKDEIWNDIKEIYHPSYLPIHQRILLKCIYGKNVNIYYLIIRCMENKLVYMLKKIVNI